MYLTIFLFLYLFISTSLDLSTKLSICSEWNAEVSPRIPLNRGRRGRPLRCRPLRLCVAGNAFVTRYNYLFYIHIRQVNPAHASVQGKRAWFPHLPLSADITAQLKMRRTKAIAKEAPLRPETSQNTSENSVFVYNFICFLCSYFSYISISHSETETANIIR